MPRTKCGTIFLLDEEDKNRLKNYTFFIKGSQYIWAYLKGSNTKPIRLQKLLLKSTNNERYCDHINLDKLDYRKRNLRIVKPGISTQNQAVRKNKKLPKGVSIDKSSRKKPYYARIAINYKVTTLGYFKTIQKAVNAYNRAAVKYYGLQARLSIHPQPDKQQNKPNTPSKCHTGDN